MSIIRANSNPEYRNWVRSVAQDDGSYPILDWVDQTNQVLLDNDAALVEQLSTFYQRTLTAPTDTDSDTPTIVRDMFYSTPLSGGPASYLITFSGTWLLERTAMRGYVYFGAGPSGLLISHTVRTLGYDSHGTPTKETNSGSVNIQLYVPVAYPDTRYAVYFYVSDRGEKFYVGPCSLIVERFKR